MQKMGAGAYLGNNTAWCAVASSENDPATVTLALATHSVPRPRELEPPQCAEELEDEVFQAEDGVLGTQPGSLLSADLFARVSWTAH
jgi:hypothetical protein